MSIVYSPRVYSLILSILSHWDYIETYAWAKHWPYFFCSYVVIHIFVQIVFQSSDFFYSYVGRLRFLMRNSRSSQWRDSGDEMRIS